MSQFQDNFPFLRAASYEMPSAPASTVSETPATVATSSIVPSTPSSPANNHHHASSSRAVTPSSSRDCLKQSSTSQMSSVSSPIPSSYLGAPSTTETLYTPNDIASMNTALSRARQAGELPKTTSSPMNAQTVLEDFGFLTKLRELRGDPSLPFSESYQHFLVEVTRRIQERDSAMDEDETRREAARRVNNYLRSIEQERFFFDAATSAATVASPRSCGSVESQVSSPSTPPSLVDAETFSEEVLSIVEQVADQTLLDAVEPLRKQTRCLGSQAEVLGQQNDVFYQQNQAFGEHNDVLGQQAELFGYQNHTFNQQLGYHQQQQEHLIKTLKNLLEPQNKMVQMSSENLTLITAIINQLSQVVMNLPQSIDMLVHNAVQKHVQDAIQDVMHAQQQAMLSLVREESRRRPLVDYDLLAVKVAECVNAGNTVKLNKMQRGGRIGKAIRRAFRR